MTFEHKDCGGELVPHYYNPPNTNFQIWEDDYCKKCDMRFPFGASFNWEHNLIIMKPRDEKEAEIYESIKRNTLRWYKENGSKK